MIGGISGIGAPGIITNITANSLGGISPVERVVRRRNEGQSAEIGEQPVLLQPSQPVDYVLLGEKTPPSGESYGLSANQLRNRGMALQLEQTDTTGFTNAEESAVAVGAASNPINAINADNADNADNAINAANANTEKSSTAKSKTEIKTGEAKISEVDDENENSASKKSADDNDKNRNGEPLTAEEQQQVDKLRARDQEVRTHEQAHLAAAGQYATGGASFEYQTGADGKKYAIGGHVGIDVSPEATPEATVTKMQQVRRAALAPAEPSGQDRSVSVEAAQKLAEAQRQIYAERSSSSDESDKDAETESGETENAEIADSIAAGATSEAQAGKAGENLTAKKSSANGLDIAAMADKIADFVNKNSDNHVAKITGASEANNATAKKLDYQQMRGQLAYRMAI